VGKEYSTHLKKIHDVKTFVWYTLGEEIKRGEFVVELVPDRIRW
jgi:hypothetical protein